MVERTFGIKLSEEELRAVIQFHLHQSYEGSQAYMIGDHDKVSKLNTDRTKRIHELTRRLLGKDETPNDQKPIPTEHERDDFVNDQTTEVAEKNNPPTAVDGW